MTRPIAVLIVDNDPGVYTSIRMWLEDDGFQVRVATTGADALRILADAPIDVGLVDLRLPDMSGEDLLCRALPAYPASKFMIHTGIGYYRLSDELHRLGMEEDDIVFKPAVDLSRFSRLIRRKASGAGGSGCMP
jgi:two-component system response regulator ChvI